MKEIETKEFCLGLYELLLQSYHVGKATSRLKEIIDFMTKLDEHDSNNLAFTYIFIPKAK